MQNGKGDRNRSNLKKYQQGWERIFGTTSKDSKEWTSSGGTDKLDMDLVRDILGMTGCLDSKKKKQSN